MEWVVGIVEPLFGRQELAHIGDDLSLWLGDEIMDGLNAAIGIGHGDARPAVALAGQGIALPAL